MTIKDIREEKGISQSDLSRMTGISVRSIQSYEQDARDIRKMQLITAYKIASALDMTCEDLLMLYL